jgi:hypothetical protein
MSSNNQYSEDPESIDFIQNKNIFAYFYILSFKQNIKGKKMGNGKGEKGVRIYKGVLTVSFR